MDKLYTIINSLRASGRHIKPGDPDDALEELSKKQIDRLIQLKAIAIGKNTDEKKQAEPPLDDEKLKAAVKELVADGTGADKITVAQMSEKIGRKVKKTEFESFVQAEIEATKE